MLIFFILICPLKAENHDPVLPSHINQLSQILNLEKDTLSDIMFSRSQIIKVTHLRLLALSENNLLIFLDLQEGDYGYIIQTSILNSSNQGKSWQQSGFFDGRLFELFVLDQKYLWAISQWEIEASSPSLYHSKDYGQSWEKIDIEDKPIREEASQRFKDRLGDHPSFGEVYADQLFFKNPKEGSLRYYLERPVKKNSFYLISHKAGKIWQLVKKGELKKFKKHPPKNYANFSYHYNKTDKAFFSKQAFDFRNIWKLVENEKNYTILQKNKSQQWQVRTIIQKYFPSPNESHLK
ncbi:MAG: hypothetical protein KDK66_01840 [Deltaproteobacteria bacterium]|nr:hypothetical protein [Deltaproteobacteria bacterium]